MATTSQPTVSHWAHTLDAALTPQQRTVSQFIQDNPCSGVFMEMGQGKAQPLYSKVLTPTGWTTMGNITLGDTVVVPNGDTASVAGVFPQGERDVYTLTLADGRTVDADENHLWSVRVTSRIQPNTRSFTDTEPITFTTTKIKELLSDNIVTIDTIEPFNHTHMVFNRESYRQTVNSFVNNIAANHVDTANMQFISVLPLHVRMAIASKLLINTTLTVRNKHVCVTIKHNLHPVVKQCWKDLIYSLGGSITFTETPQGIVAAIFLPHRIALRLGIRPGGKPPIKTIGNYSYQEIVSVKYKGTVPTQCILIDHPLHEYVTDNFVRTHNTLATIHALAKIQPAGHMLIVAPKNIAVNTWDKEFRDWNIPIRVQSLLIKHKTGRMTKDRMLTPSERNEVLSRVWSDPPTVYITSVDQITKVIDFFATKEHTRKTPNYALWPFPTMIFDEVQAFKNPRSSSSKAVHKILPYTTRRICLTGTPRSEDLSNVFGIMRIIDNGYTFGTSEYRFMETFFHKVKTNAQGVVIKWRPKKGARDAIYNSMKPYAITVETDHSAMTNCTITDTDVVLDEDMQKTYQLFKKQCVLDLMGLYYGNKPSQTVDTNAASNIYIDNATSRSDVQALLDGVTMSTVAGAANMPTQLSQLAQANASLSQYSDQQISNTIASNAAVLRNKLLQFASGAIYLDSPDSTAEHMIIGDDTVPQAYTTDGKPYVLIHDHKFDAFLDVLSRHNINDTPILVAYRFGFERDYIMSRLNDITAYTGKVHVFDGSKQMLTAWNNKEIPMLLIHPKSAGHGLNFQHGGHILIWYSLPDSSEQYVQTNARLYRKGQTEDVTIHRLITVDTYDGTLPGLLEKKRINEKTLLDAVMHEIMP